MVAHTIAVTSAPGCVQSIRVLRVLCREEFSVAAAKTFVDDLKRAMQWLTGHYMYTPEQVPLALTLSLCTSSMPSPLYLWQTSHCLPSAMQ